MFCFLFFFSLTWKSVGSRICGTSTMVSLGWHTGISLQMVMASSELHTPSLPKSSPG